MKTVFDTTPGRYYLGTLEVKDEKLDFISSYTLEVGSTVLKRIQPVYQGKWLVYRTNYSKNEVSVLYMAEEEMKNDNNDLVQSHGEYKAMLDDEIGIYPTIQWGNRDFQAHEALGMVFDSHGMLHRVPMDTTFHLVTAIHQGIVMMMNLEFARK
jgi:hypothetical protein